MQPPLAASARRPPPHRRLCHEHVAKHVGPHHALQLLGGNVLDSRRRHVLLRGCRPARGFGRLAAGLDWDHGARRAAPAGLQAAAGCPAPQLAVSGSSRVFNPPHRTPKRARTHRCSRGRPGAPAQRPSWTPPPGTPEGVARVVVTRVCRWGGGAVDLLRHASSTAAGDRRCRTFSSPTSPANSRHLRPSFWTSASVSLASCAQRRRREGGTEADAGGGCR
jgi:hypothetical protein